MKLYAIMSADGHVNSFTSDINQAKSSLESLSSGFVAGGFPYSLVSVGADVTVLDTVGQPPVIDSPVTEGPVVTLPDPSEILPTFPSDPIITEPAEPVIIQRDNSSLTGGGNTFLTN